MGIRRRLSDRGLPHSTRPPNEYRAAANSHCTGDLLHLFPSALEKLFAPNGIRRGQVIVEESGEGVLVGICAVHSRYSIASARTARVVHRGRAVVMSLS